MLECWICKKKFTPYSVSFYHTIGAGILEKKFLCKDCWDTFRQLIKEIFNDFMTDY